MLKKLLPLIEVMVLRAGPGLINLATLMALAQWMKTEDYGLYSTIVLTTGFAANITFGALTSAVVSQHAYFEVSGDADDYESSLISSILLISIGVIFLGSIAASTSIISWAWIAPVVTFGFYQAAQAILRARLRVWAFGGAAIVQALLFLILVWVFIRPEPTIDKALTAFAASYVVATIVSLLFSGLPALSRPQISLLATTFQIGVPYTFSKIAENGLGLGFRYLILLFGTAEQLGIFSFCVDLAQRLIGFLLNAARFIIVPAAFKADAQGDTTNFQNTLVSGTRMAVGMAVIAFIAVLTIRETGWIVVLSSKLLDPVIFAIVSLAIVINQIKKVIVDPMAMRINKTSIIAIGYAISALFTLAFGLLALTMKLPWGVELTYLGGYAFATLISVITLRKAVSKTKS